MTRLADTKNPAWLVHQVFNGRPLMRNEVQAVISFALDNLMDFDDIPEVWEDLFAEVVKQKVKHYQSTIITEYPENFNPARE